jgi:ABC-type transport system substrate-binding protein
MCRTLALSPADEWSRLNSQQRRRLMQAGLGLAAGLACPAPRAVAARGAKVLRIAFPAAESSFDPAQIGDRYSFNVTNAIFEAPLAYDFLARPYRLRPMTAAALPEVSSDFRSFIVPIQPGICFADDPALKGQRRELVAADYVYALKRHFDPRYPGYWLFALEAARIVGLDALRRRAIEAHRPFDYDTPVEGLRALDRYTLQIRLEQPAPRFALDALASSGIFGVVEHYGDAIGEHPVGTGAFRLTEWRRSSRIVLERNPAYRELHYDEQPGDAAAEVMAAALHGRRLPMLDRVEISIIEEAQPRWLAFLGGEHDVLELPSDFAPLAIPNNRLAPFLAQRGVHIDRLRSLDLSIAAEFNMRHPLVGGNAAPQVALRRAIALSYDVEAEIRLVRSGQAVAAQSPLAPFTFGYDASLRSEMAEYDSAKARALLDLYGYVDRDGDGWREQPDGRPLLLEFMTQADSRSRRGDELWQKSLRAVGLRVSFKVAQWPENLKASRAGRFMIWRVGLGPSSPDSDSFLAMAYGPNADSLNDARFSLPAFDRLYRAQAALPDGPERAAAMAQAAALMIAYMPYKLGSFAIDTDMAQPWVIGHRHHPFTSPYRFIDIDAEMRAGRQH